ncbi:MAG: type II toxin-antitoxin system VapC family toxin [Pirellulales bacterium]
MASFFLDTSAIVKRYISEAGTGWVVSLADPATRNDLYIARIAEVEVTSAIVRRDRGGSLAPSVATAALMQFRHDLANQYQTTEITDALLARATSFAESDGLRAYDAVQLAAVVELAEQHKALSLASPILVSADQELNAAAIAAGMTVENPNTHP